MDVINMTPQALYDQMKKTIIGQDSYLQALSTAAWLHIAKYQHFLHTGDLIEKPKQNLLIIGGSGTGKTLAVQTLGQLLDLPVIIVDASSLTGEGWRGKSLSSIIPQIYHATDRAEERIYSIVVFDEIDKVFRSNRSNALRISESGFLPINNLLTFLAGGTVTCTDKDCNCSLDVSNLLIICLGAFEGLDKIVKKRLTGDRQIGFCGNGHNKAEDDDDILQHVTEADLHEFGIPWELLGRISHIARTRSLDTADYKRILTQSDVSPIRQFNSLLSKTSDVRVSITDEAVAHIAAKAGETKEGARMLARLVSQILQPAIFGIGDDPDISGIEIDYGNNELFTRSEYDMYTDREEQDEDDSDLFVRANPDYRSTVPLPCNRNRGDILLFAEKIKKSSKRKWMLPETYVSAATCIIAAAICSQLVYASDDDKNLLTLYRQIDGLPSDCIPHPAGHLELMINEFIQKAQKDIGFEKAKTNAKHFVVDYCRDYSISGQQYSA